MSDLRDRAFAQYSALQQQSRRINAQPFRAPAAAHPNTYSLPYGDHYSRVDVLPEVERSTGRGTHQKRAQIHRPRRDFNSNSMPLHLSYGDNLPKGSTHALSYADQQYLGEMSSFDNGRPVNPYMGIDNEDLVYADNLGEGLKNQYDYFTGTGEQQDGRVFSRQAAQEEVDAPVRLFKQMYEPSYQEAAYRGGAAVPISNQGDYLNELTPQQRADKLLAVHRRLANGTYVIPE
jgi:hypothetical protein